MALMRDDVKLLLFPMTFWSFTLKIGFLPLQYVGHRLYYQFAGIER